MGVILALTADHGMKAKHNSAKAPNVIYLQSFMDDCFGEGTSRVICPITDPYVVHHGALGGFVTIYLDDHSTMQEVIARLSHLEGIETVVTKEEAARRYELPLDRIGDLVVISKGGLTLGTSEDKHDLSGLKVPLRSHGGISEQKVPFILNKKTSGFTIHKRLRNFDIFDAALNHAEDR
jgi:phosphonoacetate hydrolase